MVSAMVVAVDGPTSRMEHGERGRAKRMEAMEKKEDERMREEKEEVYA